MKNLLRKSIGLMLIVLMLLSTFTACVNDNADANHPSGDGEHTHNYEWLTDIEPTYTSPGIMHKECACGKKSDENTEIERLLHEEEHQVGLVVDFPNRETFSSKEKIVEFYEKKQNKINGSFLCIDVSSKPEKGIYITLSPVDHYGFYYDEEHENEYISPYIVVSYGIYSNELGPIYDEMVDGGESVSFVMYFYNIESSVDYYQLEFYTIKDCENALDNVVQIMNGGICIGTIYYGSDVYINREWMADYLLDNLFFIN